MSTEHHSSGQVSLYR